MSALNAMNETGLRSYLVQLVEYQRRAKRKREQLHEAVSAAETAISDLNLTDGIVAFQREFIEARLADIAQAEQPEASQE